MYDNYNYPMGADTPSAPWNQPGDPDPVELNIEVTMCLTHKTTVQTTNYDDCTDEEGYTERDFHDTETDIHDYYEKQHKSIPQLLNELAKYINGELQSGGLSSMRRQELEEMLDDCNGWTVNDFELEDYDY